MPDDPARICDLYLRASASRSPLCVSYGNVCYLGRQSIEPFRYSDFILLGFKETNHLVAPFPIIGIDQIKPVAAIVDDGIVQVIQEALHQGGLLRPAVVPFILTVVAIDAALLGTMWAVAVSASLD